MKRQTFARQSLAVMRRWPYTEQLVEAEEFAQVGSIHGRAVRDREWVSEQAYNRANRFGDTHSRPP